MTGFVTALNTGLSADAMWGAVTPLVPLIITVTLFALTFYVARRLTKKSSKGKGGF